MGLDVEGAELPVDSEPMRRERQAAQMPGGGPGTHAVTHLHLSAQPHTAASLGPCL
jgi:hypothetical protein